MSIPGYKLKEIKDVQEMSDAPTMILIFVLAMIFMTSILFNEFTGN